MFCLAVGPREILSQRISVGSGEEEGGGQPVGPVEKKVKVDLGPERAQERVPCSKTASYEVFFSSGCKSSSLALDLYLCKGACVLVSRVRCFVVILYFSSQL